MAETDATYQPKVGIEQGAEKLYVRADGYFKFFDQDITGETLKAVIGAQAQADAIIINSVGVLSTINIPSNTGYVFYSLTDAASNASAWLPSCKAGQVMVLMGRGGGSIASIFISTLTGVTAIGILSGGISSINFHFSAASQPFVRLVATADNEWSVVETLGQVTLQADA